MKLNTDLIERRRIELNIRKVEFAKMIGMSRQNLYKKLYGKNDASLREIEKIAKALSLDEKDLLVHD